MKQISEYANKIDYKDPKHWIIGGFILLILAVMKTVLIFMAIGLFIAAIFMIKKNNDSPEKTED